MERIVRFAHWKHLFHWFVRRDGAWFLLVGLPLRRTFLFVGGGLDMSGVDPRRVVGYYHHTLTNNAFGMILHEPGKNYEEHHFLAYAEDSGRFSDWLASLV